MKLQFALPLFCLLLTACKKDDPEIPPSNDPPAPCAEEITFTKNNFAFVIHGWSTWSNWRPDGTTGRRIIGDGYSGSTNIFIDFNGEVEEGTTYQLGTPEAVLAFSDQSLLKMWYSTAGSVTVTEKDETLKVLRGTFEATVYNDGTALNPQGGTSTGAPSTVELTDGTFDIHYTE